MLRKKDLHGIVVGAAIGTLLGSLSAFFAPKSQQFSRGFRNPTQGWLEKAKGVSGNVLDEVKNFRNGRKPVTASNHFSKGALLGILFGAGAALLFSPRTGKQIRKDLAQKYQDISQKTEDFIHVFNNNTHPQLKSIRKAVSKKKRSLAKSNKK